MFRIRRRIEREEPHLRELFGNAYDAQSSVDGTGQSRYVHPPLSTAVRVAQWPHSPSAPALWLASVATERALTDSERKEAVPLSGRAPLTVPCEQCVHTDDGPRAF